MAISCAKRFNTSPYLAAVLVATLLSTGINGVENLSIFGIEFSAITYSNNTNSMVYGICSKVLKEDSATVFTIFP